MSNQAETAPLPSPEDELSELAELRQLVETLRQSVCVRDDFIGIAHELHNPMTPIFGVAELAIIAARKAEGKCLPRVITPCWSICSVSFTTMCCGQ